MIASLLVINFSPLNSLKNNKKDEEDFNFLSNQFIIDKTIFNQFATSSFKDPRSYIILSGSQSIDPIEILDRQCSYSSGTISYLNDTILYEIFGFSSILLLCSISLIVKSRKGLKKDNIADIGKIQVQNTLDIHNIYKVEEILIDLIQEYLEMNKCFNKEKILPYLINRIHKMDINVNSNGIKSIIKTLEEKKVVIQGSKLIKQNILDNSNRSKIYNFIEQNPGTYLNKIVTSLNLNIFIIKWHLNMLVKFEIVRETQINHKKIYFDSDIPLEFEELYYLLSNKKCSKIIDYLKSNDLGSTMHQISKNLRMHFNTVKKYLKEIDSKNLLLSKKFNNKTLYFIDRELIEKLIN